VDVDTTVVGAGPVRVTPAHSGLGLTSGMGNWTDGLPYNCLHPAKPLTALR
jgi:hypothetical protein